MINDKKLNRIVRYIEIQGGLNTEEFEWLLAVINRQYVKRLIMAENYRESVDKKNLY